MEKKNFLFYIVLFLLAIMLSPLYAQNPSLVETLSSTNPAPPVITTETISQISKDGDIFIITAQNGGFYKGDFITLLKNSKKAARALVAKIEDGVAGIKILKIHSLATWKELHENGEVQVLRGDDTSYSTKSSTEEGTPAKDRIESEDDLYSIEKDSDDAELEGQSKRVIKTDNIIALSYGRVSADDTTGDSSSHSYVAGSWAYQLIDNGWLELQYGRGLLVDHPSSGIDTSLSDIILRAKYTFAIPFNAYLQPYLGYQIRSAKNSDAGQDSDTVTLTQAQRDAELNAVDDVAKQQFIFGVTALKRMVPGWFIRLDLGLDVMSVGIALEF